MTKMLACGLVLALAVTCATSARAGQTVDQKDKQFSAESLNVKVGEAVTFTNSDPVSHDLSVKDPDGSRMMGAMEKPGDQLQVTFDKAGQYKVQCLIHPKMKMTVTAE